ncbi:hypothetical protein DFQ26_003712 [Actinomortierella ambigua]|nr:hypothetical protein DFQ26_003712 [Actinomortierella ambigua]
MGLSIHQQSSLYCSDACRKADALACCVFHDCKHPDVSEVHDHLTFCHHHRPAIRIPFLPVAAPASVSPRQQQHQHQHQHQRNQTHFSPQHQHQQQYQHQQLAPAQDAWMHFFQNQFHQHHPQSHQYQAPRHTGSFTHGNSSPAGTSTASSHCHTTRPNNDKNAPALGHHMNRSSLSSMQALSSPSLDLLPTRQPLLQPKQQQQQQQALSDTSLSLLGLGQNQRATANQQSPWERVNMTLPGEAQGDDGGHHPRAFSWKKDPAHRENSSFFSGGPFSLPGLPPIMTEPHLKATLRTSQRDIVAIAAEENDAICTTPCIVRKNKALPPPTLSPILPTVISNPASLVPSSETADDDDNSSLSSWSSVESAWSSSASSDVDCHGWPRMDRYFFPDHCCRTANCYSKSAVAKASTHPFELDEVAMEAKGRKNDRLEEEEGDGPTPTLPSLPRSAKERRRSFGSELPPPTKVCQHLRGNDPSGTHLSALSDSIWGVGWHQVQPLPPCFVACMQQQHTASGATTKGGSTKGGSHHYKKTLSTNGCCKSGDNHVVVASTAGAAIPGAINGTASSRRGSGGNQASNKKGGKKHAKATAETSSAKTLLAATMCRLPRSLQFIE